MDSFLFCIRFVFLLLVFALTSCGNAGKSGDASDKDSSLIANEVPEVIFPYRPQIFKIDPLEFRLNKDDLPFPFNEEFLRLNKIRSVKMHVALKEGRFLTNEDYRWSVDEQGKILSEEKNKGGRVLSSLERKYDREGKLIEIVLRSAEENNSSGVNRITYKYAEGKLVTATDHLTNGDSVQTSMIYKEGKLVAKKMKGSNAVSSRTEISWYAGRPSKLEFFPNDTAAKTGIHSFTYTKKGKLLYADQWYPGISNDTYIFEFDSTGLLTEITYKTFVNKDQLKIPGRTKSYRFIYTDDMLRRINYFMQASTFNQSGTFEFTYEYYK